MKPPPPDAAIFGAQSVDRALRLLALIARQSHAGIGLTGLVDQSGLNKATVRRLLLALMRAGLVEQAADSRAYHLGEEAFILGLLAGGRHGLVSLALDSLHRLAQETGDAAFLSVRRGFRAVCLHREDGAHPIRTYALMPGASHPLGVGAGSLAMLAALPDAMVQAAIAANAAELRRRFPNLPPDALPDHVARTRAAGIALNPGLIFEDSWGLGAALCGPDGLPLGALSLAAIESRMRLPRRDALARLLRHEARRIEQRLCRPNGAPAPRAKAGAP